MIHKYCFKKLVFDCTSKCDSVKCPECQMQILDFEIKSVLPKKDIDDLEKMEQLNIIKNNKNFIQCSCGNVMEIV